ncbi:hypothetical protein IAQ61_006951 [Plenodomus lingam]|nr:hypothetical protein IAQ61_006951 [Plenodomus lingam]
MVHGKTLLLILRAFTLVLTLIAVALSARSQNVVHNFKINGPAALDALSENSPDGAKHWRDFFTAVLDGVSQISASIATSTIASLVLILVLCTTTLSRLTISKSALVPMETLSMCLMAIAFGTSLSFSASLNAFKEDQLADMASSDLAQYTTLVPLSKGLVVLTCFGWLFTMAACLIATVDACKRARVKERDSFRPTASALGMSPRYPDIVPQMVRSRVPTMYDPWRPLQTESKKTSREADEESSKLLRKDEERAYRESALTEYGRSSVELEREFMGLLNVDKPEKALQFQPKRPWSESPIGRKRDDDVVDMHSM